MAYRYVTCNQYPRTGRLTPVKEPTKSIVEVELIE
jgi:hypothetical protein